MEKEIFMMKPSKVLMVIEDGMIMGHICKKMEVTYAHLFKVIKKLIEADMIIKSKEAKYVRVYTTMKGREIRKHLESIQQMMEE